MGTRVKAAGARLHDRWGRGAVAAALGIIAPMLATAPGAAPPASAGLTPFASCDALRQWYVDHTISQVGPFGWDGQALYAMRAAEQTPLELPLDSASGGAETGVIDSATGTNTQEAGVDEPDVAKTDGHVVVRLQGQQVVITDVSGSTPRQLATWALPAQSHADGLLLVDGHVLLAGDGGRRYVTDTIPGGYGGSDTTDVYDLDVTDPSTPRLAAHTTWSGAVLSLRQYGDTVRLVTSTGLPDLAFLTPHQGLGEAEATARNRDVVRESTIQQWLPQVRVEGMTSHRAVDCSQIFHPALLTGPARDTATIGVFTLHPGAPDPVSAVAVTGRGSQVYSSSDRLYVWDTLWNQPFLVDPRRTPVRPILRAHTDVHAFALDGDQTRYLASGRIDGQVRDRWSFDEHDGHLRVAVTWPARFPTQLPDDPVAPDSSGTSAGDNGVVVLDEQGDRLVEVGRLQGLGRDEQIQSVRWFDDLAVLVTYRQTDPLFTVDLTDPTQPRALGALSLPGYSSYLHPIGDDRLLGLGTAGTPVGAAQGAKAAVFDLADPAHASELGEVGLGPSSWLTVAQDQHAFTWLGSDSGSDTGAGTGTAITQVERPQGGAVLLALHVYRDGHLTTRPLPAVGGWEQRALPLPDGRVALVGDRVVVLPARG